MFSVFAFLIYYFVVYAFFSPGSQTFFRLTMFGLFLASALSLAVCFTAEAVSALR